MTAKDVDWHRDIFEILHGQNISLVAHVPDAAHSPLIKMC
ncbi:uncharacterized protein METZ01_LOCUS249132 [marine metagenome]|uniref:Uncharacterized protein n=1 Tax=marine metagenome TaxID=408172 RepID=A0A382I9U5_9ZZZZ